ELPTSLAAPVTLRLSGEPGFFTMNERPRMVWSAACAHPASIIDSTAATADTLAIRFIGPSLTSGIRRRYPALRRRRRAYRRARIMSRRRPPDGGEESIGNAQETAGVCRVVEVRDLSEAGQAGEVLNRCRVGRRRRVALRARLREDEAQDRQA